MEVTHRFSVLPAEPPSTPEDLSSTISHGLPSVRPNFAAGEASSRMQQITPPVKRVEFSPSTSDQRDPTFGLRQLRHLPPSKGLKSSRSILKPSARPIRVLHGPENLDGPSAAPYTFKTFAQMLESVVQQLAGPVRSSRLDAYRALIGTLSACDGVPGAEAMMNKMGLIVQFIQRDMVATMPDSSKIDTTLATQAIKLAEVLMWHTVYAERLDAEFRCFLIDRSVMVLGDAGMPKAVVLHHMSILAQQKFDIRIIRERADRILTSLQDIQERITGNGVIGLRLSIYNKMLAQATPTMLDRRKDWIHHLFHGLLSGIRESRTRAIELGLHAGKELGSGSKLISKTALQLFNMQIEGQGIYIDALITRLHAMLETKDKQDSLHVPQIWTVILMFFRSCRDQLEKWPHFSQCLQLIQDCFNYTDLSLRHQASIAWNRLVYVLMPDRTTSKATIRLLRQPVVAQLESRAADKHAKRCRQLAMSSYYNLLYYALRPSASPEQLDLYWEEYVEAVLRDVLSARQSDVRSACEVLAALFGNSATRTWDQHRALASAPDMVVDEIPRLDPRWVRQRIGKVAELACACIEESTVADPNSETAVHKMWSSLMKAIADASSSEIRASLELRTAIAEIMNILHRIWRKETSLSAAVTTRFLIPVDFLAQTAMQCIGPLYFTEKILVRKNGSDFEAAVTPSHRKYRSQGPLQSPILYLLELLAGSRVDDATEKTAVCNAAHAWLMSCCTSGVTRTASLDSLNACAQHLYLECCQSSSFDYVWKAIAESAENVLGFTKSEAAYDNLHRLNADFRNVVNILAIGFHAFDKDCFTAGESLYRALLQAVKAELGDSTTVLSVIEPLAQAITKELNEQARPELLSNGLAYGCLLLEFATFPPNGRVVEHAEKALWGFSDSVVKTPIFDPFSHLCRFINVVMKFSYAALERLRVDVFSRFLCALKDFIIKTPPSSSMLFLQKIQEGIGTWIKDDVGKLGSKTIESNTIHITLTALWKSVLTRLDAIPNKDTEMLKTSGALLYNGASSRHRTISNFTVTFMRKSVNLQPLPSRTGADNELSETFPPLFAGDGHLAQPCLTADVNGASDQNDPESGPSNAKDGTLAAAGNDSRSSPMRHSPEPNVLTQEGSVPSSPLNRTPERRRRYDSQMHFAAIESSPLRPAAAEPAIFADDHETSRQLRSEMIAALFPSIKSSELPRPADLEVAEAFDERDLGIDAVEMTLLPDLSVPGEAPIHYDTGQVSNGLPILAPAPILTAEDQEHLLPLLDDVYEVDEIEQDMPSSPPPVPETHEVPELRDHLTDQPMLEPMDETTFSAQLEFSTVSAPEPQAGAVAREPSPIQCIGEAELIAEAQFGIECALQPDAARAALVSIEGSGSNEAQSVAVNHSNNETMYSTRHNLGSPEQVTGDGVTDEKDVEERVSENETIPQVAETDIRIQQGSTKGAESCQMGESQAEGHVSGRDELIPAITTSSTEDDVCRGAIYSHEEIAEVSCLNSNTDKTSPSEENMQRDIFVDARSSPSEEPQVFVDASPTLLAEASSVKDEMRLPLLKEAAPRLNVSSEDLLIPQTISDVNSRVEDSFAGDAANATRLAEDVALTASTDIDQSNSQVSVGGSHDTPRGSRKRKSSSSNSVKPSKKQKQAVSSHIDGVRHTPEGSSRDEDVGDCIVVASQPSQSSQSSRLNLESSNSRPAQERHLRAPSKKSTKVGRPRLSAPVAGKGPNPRKRRLPLNTSEELARDKEATASPRDEQPITKRRRKSQVISGRSNPPSASRVVSPRSKIFSHIEIPLKTPEVRLGTERRVGTRKMYEEDEVSTTESENPETSSLGCTSRRAQVKPEQDPRTGNTPHDPVRRNESPGSSRGILARLKDILQDCRKLILRSSPEERELDDVLFHLRREVHEAGRRGRTA